MYKTIASLDIAYGEYQARCSCCCTFRTNPQSVLPKAKYDNKVRQAVLDRILDDGLNVEATLHCLQRDFLLNLSPGFVYDCLHDAAAALNLAEHRQSVLSRFQGVLCVDEIHLGQYTLLLATDPVGDFPVAFALVATNDQQHMERFLANLAHWGLQPKVVVTDRSNLYPSLIAKLWPKAEHQLCVFHVMQDINELVLDAVKRLRGALKRRGRGGRRRKRGRPSRAQQRRAQKRGPTNKDKAQFVFKHRYLIVMRREKLQQQQRRDLQKMLEYLPELGTLRKFVDSIHRLFAAEQSEYQAWCRWWALRHNELYWTVPELRQVLEMLAMPEFSKMIAFLRGPASLKRRIMVRTNNHVERCNRKLRFWEKVRYKWRRRRTLVRFIVLEMDRWWKEVFTPPAIKSGKGDQRTGTFASAA
ncbi:MAG: transposase [Acidobacteriaceae bacterium]|nr:transposase [Acidobacteriaceae bacterium]